MNCRRCGSVLPSEGFVCKVCGALMDTEQIQNQKANMQKQANQRPNLMSEQNGKYHIEHNTESVSNKGLMAAVMLIIIAFLIIISLIIFFIKR